MNLQIADGRVVVRRQRTVAGVVGVGADQNLVSVKAGDHQRVVVHPRIVGQLHHVADLQGGGVDLRAVRPLPSVFGGEIGCTRDKIVEKLYIRVKAAAEGGYTDPSDVVEINMGVEGGVSGIEDGSAVENVQTAITPIKIIENGQVYILRNGVRYNLLGRTAQ